MNFSSHQSLVDNILFSHIMAWKIAGSGLKSHHLELEHKRKPDGIHVLFIEEHVGTVRVTRKKKNLIESVVSQDIFLFEKNLNIFLYLQLGIMECL